MPLLKGIHYNNGVMPYMQLVLLLRTIHRLIFSILQDETQAINYIAFLAYLNAPSFGCNMSLLKYAFIGVIFNNGVMPSMKQLCS